MSDTDGGFAGRLRACRGSAGLTQEELAERSGLSVRAIRNLERGQVRRPFRETLHRLAGALELPDGARTEFIDAAGRRPAPAVGNTVHGDGDGMVASRPVTVDRESAPVSVGTADGPAQQPASEPARPPASEPARPPASEPARPPGSVPAQLPAGVPYFTGRARELHDLSALMGSGNGTVVISAIGGMGGIGKTALAVHWAHQVAGRFPDGQLYVNLRGFGPSPGPMPAHAAVRIFLDGLGVPPERIPHDPEAQAALYRSMLAMKRVLVLVDNARDEQQVRPLLPGSPGCLVLITSRNQLAGLVAVDGARAFNLGVLTDTEARALLTQRLGASRVEAQAGAAVQIIARCAGLPLALNIAAAHAAARPRARLKMLADELGQPEQRLGQVTGDVLSDLPAVFSWSYQALGEPAARMFRLLSLHPGPDISLAAAASLAGLAPREAERDLAALTGISMLTEHPNGRFSLHDLLRVYAAQKAAEYVPSSERDAAVLRMLDHYLHTAENANRVLYPSVDPLALPAPVPGVTPESFTCHTQALAWYIAERHVLLAATRAGFGVGHYACELPQALSRFLRRQGHWQDEIAVQELTLRLASAGGCDQVGHQARAYRSIGAGFDLAGDRKQALHALEQALRLFRQLDDTVSQGRVYYSLGRVFQGQGQTGEALRCSRTALSLFESAGHRAGQALALDGTSWCLIQLGHYGAALSAAARALRLHRQLSDLPGEANAMDNFGRIHQQLGHTAQAIACYRRSLAIFEETGDRYTLPWILTRTGDAYYAADDLPAAWNAWRRAQQMLDQIGHSDADSLRAKLAGLPGGNTSTRL